MQKQKTGGRIGILAAAAAILVGAVALVGLVYAALRDTTSAVINNLEPVVVTCDVNETFDGQTKSDVSITNTGEIPAFIRAKVVINWTDADGYETWFTGSSDYGYSVTLASPLNWTNENGSSVINDGYWYYNGIVQPGDKTDDLIASITENLSAAAAADPQYHLKVTVLAEALQAAPVAAAEQSWGMTYNGSSWTAYTAP
jgi:hypothetical protein